MNKYACIEYTDPSLSGWQATFKLNLYDGEPPPTVREG